MTTPVKNQNQSAQNLEILAQEFSFQCLYVKKISFNAPAAPQIFRAD